MKKYLFVLSILLTFFVNSQTIIDIPIKTIYACSGDSVKLPRVRIITDINCVDSSLFIPCLISTAILAPTCGCDQLQYPHYDIAGRAGLTYSTGSMCPSQLNYWYGGNGGIFTNNQIPFYGLSLMENAVFYSPTSLDLFNGYSMLYFGAGGETDSLKIYYTSGVNLGPDKNICVSSSSQISLISLSDVPIYNPSYNGAFIGSPGWYGGTGTYSPSTFVENPVYNPSVDEITTGYVDFTFLNPQINGSCKSDTVRYFLVSNTSPINQVDAGSNIYMCTNSPSLTLSGSGVGYSQLFWEGAGIFSNPNALITSYFPTAIEQDLGYGNIILTSLDLNNCSVTDTVYFRFNSIVNILNNIITITPLNAPLKEIIICIDSNNFISLSSIVKGVSNGLAWTSNGSGTFSNPSGQNTDYLPSSSDLNGNFFKIYLQSFGCNNPIDSLKVKIQNVNNLNVSYGSIPTNIFCGETISFPTSTITITGTVPWGNLGSGFCIYPGPFYYSFYTTLDDGNIPLSYSSSTGYLYNIGPLSEGTHQLITYLKTGIQISTAGGGIGNQEICNLPIDTLIINVTTVSDTILATACDSYVWNGTTYSESGVYTGTTANCVTESLDLTIIPSSTNTTTAAACDYYTWNGTTYTASGVFTGTTANCVTEFLNLTITPSSTNTTTASACDYYTWNGTTYTASGVFTGTTANCVTQALNLTIIDGTTNTTTASACNSYTWNGISYTASGVYTGTTTNCVTESLNLTIIPSSTNLTSQNACDTYTWNGQTYTASGVYTGTTANCVTQALNLTINTNTSSSISQTALDSYTWPANNQTYTTTGAYTAVIPNAAGCDSTITLNLTMSFSGINDLSASKLSIYPNPTNGDFTITGLELIGTVSSLTLTDMNGKVVKVLDPKATKFSMSSIKPGVYFLNIISGNKQEVLKIVKE